MELPKWKKTFSSILSSAERVVSSSKNVILSAGVFALFSGQPAIQTKIPSEKPITIKASDI